MTLMQTSIPDLIDQLGRAAREAALELAGVEPEAKNRALRRAAELLEANAEALTATNAKDTARARENGLTDAMVERLTLNPKRLGAMATALREIAALPDPVGDVVEMTTRPNGLRVGRVRAPIGVIGFIYESRPNVTTDAAGLCLKSGNAVILRGGSEAIHSNRALAESFAQAVREAGLPEAVVQLIPITDREAVGALLKADRYVDLIIPRGGKGLIERITRDSIIPVLKHLDGNCHVYVDESADFAMAERIVLNSKTQRNSVCNAAESLLVHESIAHTFLPRMVAALTAAGVEVRGCEQVQTVASAVKPATEEDWGTEYLGPIISCKVVGGFDEAVAWINRYSSHHTEAIVTSNYARAMAFTRRVDSACVHVNCSTRFSDGGEYGLGAEIGISTDKLHARGPVGLKELTTAKWVVLGEGQVRT